MGIKYLEDVKDSKQLAEFISNKCCGHYATIIAQELLNARYAGIFLDEEDYKLMKDIAACSNEKIVFFALRGFWQEKIQYHTEFNYRVAYKFAQWLIE